MIKYHVNLNEPHGRIRKISDPSKEGLLKELVRSYNRNKETALRLMDGPKHDLKNGDVFCGDNFDEEIKLFIRYIFEHSTLLRSKTGNDFGDLWNKIGFNDHIIILNEGECDFYDRRLIGLNSVKINGMNTTEDFYFFGFMIGSNTGFPCYAMLYFDGKSLRAYIPRTGNSINLKTWRPIGIDASKMYLLFHTDFKAEDDDLLYKEINMMLRDFTEESGNTIVPDTDAVRRDIASTFQLHINI